MIKYKCGHETDGVIIMNESIMAIATYLMWAEDYDNFNTEEQCFPCFCKELEVEK